MLNSFLLLFLSLSLSCKTSERRERNPQDQNASSSASNMIDLPELEIPEAPGLGYSPFIVTDEGESILAVDPKDKADFEAEIVATEASKANSGEETSEPLNPQEASDQVIENASIVLAAFAGGAATVGGVIYAKNALSHEGGALAYFLKPFSKPYFHMNVYLNERAVLKGKKPAYNEILDYDKGPLDEKGNRLINSETGKPYEILPSSRLYNSPNLKGRKLYLGMLPTDSVVKGEIDAYLKTNKALNIDWSNVETVSMVEKFETQKMSKLEVNRVSTPDNDPVSLAKLRLASEYQEKIILAGKDPYVHCKSGVGRSAEAVAVHLMDTYGMSAKDAGNYVFRQRNLVRLGDANATHIHNMRIQDYELAQRIPDDDAKKPKDLDDPETKKPTDVKKKLEDYKVNKKRLNQINEYRMIQGKKPLKFKL